MGRKKAEQRCGMGWRQPSAWPAGSSGAHVARCTGLLHGSKETGFFSSPVSHMGPGGSLGSETAVSSSVPLCCSSLTAAGELVPHLGKHVWVRHAQHPLYL